MTDKPILPMSLLFRQIGRLWSTERGNFVYLFIYLPLNFNLYFACELFKFSAFSRVQRENLFFQKKKIGNLAMVHILLSFLQTA